MMKARFRTGPCLISVLARQYRNNSFNGKGYCHRSGVVEYDFPSLLAHSCLNARKLTELAA